MSDTVTRDVTMRLRIEPAQKIDLPDFVKASGGVSAYFGGLEKGAKASGTAKKSTDEFGESLDRVDRKSKQMASMVSKNMIGAATSMSQAALSASQLVLSLKGLAGSDDDIEAMAREFVKIQMSIQGFQAGSQLIGQLGSSLGKVQKAAQAVNMTLAMTGTTATASQAAILSMAPAAAAVQAAMGPIALALGAISLTVVAVQTGMALFADSAEDAAAKAEEGWKRFQVEIDATSEAIDLAANAVNRQRQATDDLYRSQKMLKGEAFAPGDIKDVMAQDAINAKAGRSTALRGGIDAANGMATPEQMEQFRDAQKSFEAWDKIRKDQGDRFGGVEEQEYIKAFAEKERLIRESKGAVVGQDQLARIGPLSQDDFARNADLIKDLPVGMRDAIDNAMIDELKKQMATQASRHGDISTEQRETAGKTRDIDKEIDDENKKLAEERAHAQGLSVLKEKDMLDGGYSQLKEGIAGGSVLQGLEALAPHLDPSRVTELRVDIANQTIEKLLAELADAEESASEESATKAVLDGLNAKRDAEVAKDTELAKLLETLVAEAKKTEDEYRKLNAALGQR